MNTRVEVSRCISEASVILVRERRNRCSTGGGKSVVFGRLGIVMLTTLFGCQSDVRAKAAGEVCSVRERDEQPSEESYLDERTVAVRWITLAPVPTPRIAYAAAVVQGKIHVIGGLAAGSIHEIYDPESDTWHRGADLPVATHHAWAATAMGHLYVGDGLSTRVFCYDPAVGAWVDVAPSQLVHGGTAAVGVINGRIYVAGGSGREMAGDEVAVYDPRADVWTPLPSMGCARNHSVGGVIEGRLHVVGGRPGLQTCHEAFDPTTNRWTRLPDLPTGREGSGGGVAGGLLFVVGGERNEDDPDLVFASVEAYDPRAGEWILFGDMAVGQHGMFGAALDDRIFLPGGGRRLNPIDVNQALVVDRKP